MRNLISPIAIDLGTRNSGIVHLSYEVLNNKLEINSSKGELIQIDIKNKIWSQASRRITRHRIRNYKRRKLAKRLLIVILENHFRIKIKDLNFREKDALFGLLKRRGYTFFEPKKNPNEELLNQIKLPERIIKIEFAKELDNYLDLYNKIKKNPKEIKELPIESINELIKNLTPLKEDIRILDKNLSKNEIKEKQNKINNQFKENDNEVKQVIKLINDIRSPSGAKHRSEYIDDINKEIEKEVNSKYKHLDKILSKIKKEHLSNLICNISNLQLRVLRKYFNYIREDTKGVSNYKYFVPKNFNLKAQEDRKPDLDIWDESKLARIYYKWVKSWHPNKSIEDEIKNFRLLLKTLKNVKGCTNEKNSNPKETFINFLITYDPKKTIPPYEDMNNRNIGGSPVLYLNEEYLDKNFKEWNEWLKNLYENYESNLEIKINDIFEEDREKYKIDYKLIDTNKKNNEINFENFDTSKKLIIFTRMLDRSAKFDPYKFRLINSIVNSDEVVQNKYNKNVNNKEVLEKAIRTLKTVLKSENSYNKFIIFLKYYYEAIEISKQGLWDKDSFPILERKNLKLKTKGKLTEILLQAILGVDMISEVINEESEKFKKFKEFFSTSKIGNTTLKGYCEGASKLIDNANISEDNRLNNYYNYLRGRYGEVEDIKIIKNEPWYIELKNEVENNKKVEKELKNSKDKKYENNEKELKIKKDKEKEKENELKNINTEIENLKLFKNVENFANLIGKHFNQTEAEIKRYSNIYSLAQIFNILVKDRKGFSKIAKIELIENNWRSSMIRLITGQSYANASRLINDSVRLIDGFLKRVLGDQVNAIVKGKIIQLEEINFFEKIKSDPNLNLILPILFEENKFTFQEDLTILKPKKEDEKQKANSKLKNNFQDKSERIKSASNYICAYTGIGLNNSNGEIDHIFSRSSSKATQEVYNHEANLIYVSKDGNKSKSNKVYKFSDLNVTYLKNIFGESNLDLIETKIKESFNIIKKRAGGRAEKIKFHSLNLEEQKIVRHAGFISELKEDFKRIIQQRTTTQVNGVQAFLSKQIVKKFRKVLTEKGVKTNENTFKIFSVNSKDISFARNNLANINNLYKKQENQAPYSHILDAILTIPTFLDKSFAKNIKILELDEKIKEAQNFEFGLIDGNFLNNFVKEFLPKELEITKLKSKESYEKRDIASKNIFEETIYGERFKTIYYSLSKDGKEELSYGYTFKGSLPLKYKIKKNKKEYLPEEVYSLLKDFFDTDKRISRSNRVNKNKITKKLIIKETLAECKEFLNENKKYIWFQINKTKAFNFFFQYNKKKLKDEPLNEIEQIQFKLLKELHYLTKKVKIEKVNNDKNNKKDKKETSDSKSGINNSPFFKVWDKISKETSNFTYIDNELKIREFLKIPENRKRGKIRNVYSLPILPTGLGTTVRINRGEGDAKIWQLNNINKESTKAYQGFSNETNSGVFLKDLLYSNDIVFNTDKTEKIVSEYKYEKALLPFNKWIKINEITNPNVLECEINYYSEGESVSKLKYKLDFFIKEFLNNQKVNSYFQIPKNIIKKELLDVKEIKINEKLSLKADLGEKGIEVVKISQENIVFLFKFNKSKEALDLYLDGLSITNEQ